MNQVGTWQKSRLSHASGACVEVLPIQRHPKLPNAPTVAVRDSKDPDGPILVFTNKEWAAFLDGAKKGEFDHFAE